MKDRVNLFALLLIIIVLTFIISLFTGCKRGEPQKTHYNGDFKLELLFIQDGCKVYRFEDGQRTVYWSNCEGGLQTQTYHSTGKYGGYTTYEISLTNKK